MYVSTNPGLGCAGRCRKGLGSIDLSTFTWEDWLLVGAAGAALYSFMSDGKPRRKRAKSAAGPGGIGGGLDLGGVVLPMLLIGGAYVGYLYFTSQTGS